MPSWEKEEEEPSSQVFLQHLSHLWPGATLGHGGGLGQRAPLGSSLLQGVMGLKMWVLICLLQARGDWGILWLL